MHTRLARLFSLLALLPVLTYSQTSTATLSGLVRDASSAVVPGASVSARHDATGQVRSAVTGNTGDYVISGLPIGLHTISVNAQGFKTTVISGIALQVDQQARLDVTLELGSLVETVQVTETAPILQTATSSVGQVVDNSSIRSQPLNGRQFWQLIALVPGATYIPGGQTANTNGRSIRATVVNVQINGSGRIYNGWLLDGADITEYQLGGTNLQPNVDALQEFKVESADMSAEYGHWVTAINATLKSGTNEYHGSLFEFLRNDKADARNFFSLTKDSLRRNQFGFTFGGPVRRNKVFFFADMESTRQRQGIVFNNIVPGDAQRAGNFNSPIAGQRPAQLRDPLGGNFANNIIPQSRFSPQAVYFLKYMPTVAEGIFNAPLAVGSEKGDVKGDAQITDKNHVMLRYSIGDNREKDPNQYPALKQFDLSSRVQSGTMAWTHLFNPRWLNEARFSYYRSFFLFGQALPGTNFDKEAGIKGMEETLFGVVPSFPRIDLSGYTGYQGSGFDNRPKSNRVKTWQYTDNVSYTAGRHDMKFGGQYYHHTTASITGGSGPDGVFSFAPTYTGDSFGDFLLGYPDSATRGFFNYLWGVYADIWHFYWRDNFKVRPNLTLNVGLRYEHNPFHSGLRGQTSALDFATGKIVIPMRDGKMLDTTVQPQIAQILPKFQDRIIGSDSLNRPVSIRNPENDWAPRIGFAWRPRSSNRFVVRGGYGIFWIFLDTNILGNVAQTPPYQANQTAFNARPLPNRTFADPFLGEPIVPANPSPGTACAFGFAALSCATPDLATTYLQQHHSYMQQWNMSFQMQLARNLSLDVAYVGNRTIRGAQSIQENDPLPGAGQIQARRPLPQWGRISLRKLRGSGNYNSAQVKIEKRFAEGFQMLASYTNGKCIDQGTDQGGPPTGALYGVNRAVCDFNISQNLVLSSVYELPFGAGRHFLSNSSGLVNHVLGGWEVAGILTLRTGLPFTPTISSDRANTGVGGQRPTRLGSGVLDDPTPTKWFNTVDFAVPAQYTYGNSGRNILSASSLRQVDVTLQKRFRISERKGLEYRTEFFNLANHPVFSVPVTTVDTATGGRVTSTLNTARIVQFALKFYF